mmetsp:Transcript_2346/g.4953  ORF Transcript_2346/g.4953 Transcript_2346/m.4953 type:complete len:284 (-) Transcript_2346:244-1095(-)|eukprot:CAMPEP_0178436048 /NCGR_PEP_ID=MMETSP0689_2-20121128/34241_1 /TAXON_ID=160604 /ORGANISM="Amphidinium massartii, Strain CS-259" /LENGTH=283 /DNA_ID=CAMNT_0020058137 /DNA_START=9 /DNA_END=860 /DNA_ORIENTATION=-
MAADDSAEVIKLFAVVPRASGECEEFQLEIAKTELAEKLKQQIEKLTSIPADDQELFCKSPDKEHSWLHDDRTLMEQNVLDGSTLTVGVHGSLGSRVALDADADDDGDAVQSSMERHGEASYYFAHTRKYELPEEKRIVSGGDPQKLQEDLNAPAPTPPDILDVGAMVFDEDFAPKRAERHMRSYSWGDERDFVKIYITKDNEPEAIEAAGDGKNGTVEVIFKEKKFKLMVHAPEKDFVLLLDRIYYEIVPQESTFKVSSSKRITISLKKKEKTTWLKLLKPE